MARLAITPLEEKSYKNTTGWRTKNIPLEGEIIKNITLDDKKRTTLEGEKVIKTNYEKTILEERNKKKLHWRTQNKKKPWRTQNKSSYLGGEENAASAAIYVQHSQLSTTDKCKSIRLNTSFPMKYALLCNMKLSELRFSQFQMQTFPPPAENTSSNEVNF